MNFVKENSSRFKMVSLGCGSKSKVKLFGMAVFQSVPSHVRRYFKFLDRFLDQLADKCCSNLWVEVDGLMFRIVDYGSLGIVRDEFEPFMKQYFKPKNGEVVLDVGANVGKYTLTSARTVGKSGFVVAIEPNVNNYLSLLKALKVNKFFNVCAVKCAASDHDGSLKLFTGLNSGTHSAFCNQGRGVSVVECLMMDGLIKSLKLGRLDWVKVDVEGAELSVLCGLQESLLQFKPKLIVEVWDRTRREVLGLMKSLGFECLEVERLAGFDYMTLGGCSYFYCYPCWFTQVFAVKNGKLPFASKRLFKTECAMCGETVDGKFVGAE